MKSFEEQLDELEKITEILRDTATPLEHAAKEFERGMKLSKSLEKELEKMQRKVEILVNAPQNPDEKPELSLFAGDHES